MYKVGGHIKAVLAALILSPFVLCGAASGQLLDSESMECISCHETAFSDTFPIQACHQGGCDHPIGIDYAVLAMTNKGLVSPSILDPSVRLLNGKIGCTTCHVPYSQSDHQALSDKRIEIPAIPDPMLSVDNSGSMLCVSCHRK